MVNQEIEKLSFEAALAELETLVAKMEAGKMPLEELIAAYEHGASLSRHCRAKLDRLQRRIELIVNGSDPETKTPETVPFEPDNDRGGEVLF